MAETAVDLDKPWFPPLCVKSGVPTNTTVNIHTTHNPPWVHLLLPLGLLLYVIAMRRTRSKLTIAVPVSEAAWNRYQRLHWGSVGIAISGAALLIAAIVAGSGSIGALAGGLIAFSGVAYAIGESTTWLGHRYLPDRRTLILTRVHPTFAAEVADHYTREYYR